MRRSVWAAVEAEARMRGDLVEGRRHRLDLLMVGRHAGAHQSIRRRQPVDHVDLDDDSVLPQ
jgi:hypothetical protein